MTPDADPTASDYLDSFLVSAFSGGDEAAEAIEAAPPGNDPDDDAETPETIGRFTVAERLGRGGIGLVYRVEDPNLGRQLAAKVIRRRHSSDPHLVERFLEEARVCGRLQHPGVVPIHEIGTLDDGRPYFTMKVVEGKTLTELLADADRDINPQRWLEIFEKICQTVAFAHSRGVVHGDLKPPNVMVGEFGEVQVMDWGLAHSETPHSSTDAPRPKVVGTPAYMAPEQARGDIDRICLATDVFGLGALLCEILTGTPPYVGETRSEALLKASKAWLDDAHDRLRASGAEPSLINLAIRCLAPEPSDRPNDAGVVARAISDHLVAVADRARVFELEAAEARVQAAEERRARRLTVGLMASIFVGVTATVGTLWWVDHERRSRHLEAVRTVTAATERARQLHSVARSSPATDPRTWTEAVAAARLAEQLSQAPDVDGATRESTSALLVAIESEQAGVILDHTTREHLEALRVHLEESRHHTELDAEYTETFASYGLDVTSVRPEVVERIRSSAIRPALIEALDEWTFLRRRYGVPDEEAWRILVELASKTDDSSWRNEMRDAYRRADRDRLHSLAAGATPGEHSPESLDLLARCLVRLGDQEEARNVWRLASLRYPDDYWIVHNLASNIALDPGVDNAEVVRLYSMAAALRPDSAHILVDLSRALFVSDRTDEAETMIERSIAINSSSGRSHLMRAMVRHRQGQPLLALESYRIAADRGQADAFAALATLLTAFGTFEEAHAMADRLVQAKPSSEEGHFLKGRLFGMQFRLHEALASYQRASGLAPDSTEIRVLLGFALMNVGRLEEGIEVMEKVISTGETAQVQRAINGIDTANELIALEDELQRIAEGAEFPGDAETCALLAELARSREQWVLAARAYEAGMEIDYFSARRRFGLFRYEAARAAAQVGAGESADANALEAAARRSWREQALAWFQAELDDAEMVRQIGATDPVALIGLIRQWMQDPAFEPLRRGDPILSSDEHEAWNTLFSNMDEVSAELLDLLESV